MKRINYNNKVAVVTGASSGIGKSIAYRLIKKYGCTVYAIARNEEKLQKCKSDLGDLSEKYIVFPMDVSKKDSWESFADSLKSENTSIDLLINCAGVLPEFKEFEDTNFKEFEKTISINFMSQVYGVYSILPLILEGGAIVNISSSSALCPFALVSAYTASKSAAMHFTTSIAQELKNISVSAVMPGFVKTDIMRQQNVSEKEAKLIKMVSSDCEKTVSKILRRVRRRNRRIVVGADAHLMSFLYRFFPRIAPRLISWFLKKTGLELFNK